jgi:hypothetical protein
MTTSRTHSNPVNDRLGRTSRTIEVVIAAASTLSRTALYKMTGTGRNQI